MALLDRPTVVRYRSMIAGCWDYPNSTDIGCFVSRSGILPLMGWAVGGSVEVEVDGVVVAHANAGADREDIEIIFGITKAGWGCGLRVAEFSPGRHTVHLRLHDGAGTIDLGRRVFDFSVPPPVPDLAGLLNRRSDQHDGQHFIGCAPSDWTLQATSAFGFSGFAREALVSARRALVIGAGTAPVVDRAVQLDIFPFPNIDVVSAGDSLPFKSGVFDAVVCENVIEHVPNPFSLAKEIKRVLGPGGFLGINGTNLHFTHGFPSHYFNPTEFGMRHLFDGEFTGGYSFPEPADSLVTVLRYYMNALGSDEKDRIAALPVGELIRHIEARDPSVLAEFASMPDKARRAIATNVYFSGRKKSGRVSLWGRILRRRGE